MLKDITVGQYYPSGSVVHKLDPRLKILALIATIVFIFIAKSPLSVGFTVISVVAFSLATKVPLKVYFKNLKSILPVIILTAVLNMLYGSGGKTLIHFWTITITTGSVSRAVLMAIRIMLLIIISAMLTYTTTPTFLTDGIEKLLSFLNYVGLGGAVHTMAMMMTIALRFIPTLIDETDKLMNAQRARGANFDTGSLFSRVRALIPILIPLLISAVRRAFDLSEAMESRCYTGDNNRTRMKQLKFCKRDIVAAIILITVYCGIVLLNFIPLF